MLFTVESIVTSPSSSSLYVQKIKCHKLCKQIKKFVCRSNHHSAHYLSTEAIMLISITSHLSSLFSFYICTEVRSHLAEVQNKLPFHNKSLWETSAMKLRSIWMQNLPREIWLACLNPPCCHLVQIIRWFILEVTAVLFVHPAMQSAVYDKFRNCNPPTGNESSRDLNCRVATRM